MADKKISQLTGATTPLAGTEVLPIVQGGTTVKVSVDNLTKGKTVNATTFDTDVAAAKVTLSGTTLAAAGTNTNIDVLVTPKGTGGLAVGASSAPAKITTSGVVASASSGVTANMLVNSNTGIGFSAYSSSTSDESVDALYLRKNGGANNASNNMAIAFGNAAGDTYFVGQRIKGYRDGSNGNGGLIFETKSDGSNSTTAERLRLTSDGLALLGTSASVTSWTSGRGMDLQIAKSGAAYPGLSTHAYSTTAAHAGAAIFGRSRGSFGALTQTNSNDALGYLSFEGVNSSNALTAGAYIAAAQDGAAGASNIPGRIAIFTSSGSANPAERMRVSSAGDVTVSTGNLVVGTAAKGIDFSANTGAAGETSALLNWYEEGTWTPVISDGTNDATMSASNAGAYTRIGNCVTFTAYVGVQTIGSVGADAHIKGLPFTAANANRIRAGVAVGYGSSLNITQGRVVTGYVELNSSKIELQYWDAATGTTGLDGTEISDGGTLFISGHYYVS